MYHETKYTFVPMYNYLRYAPPNYNTYVQKY